MKDQDLAEKINKAILKAAFRDLDKGGTSYEQRREVILNTITQHFADHGKACVSSMNNKTVSVSESADNESQGLEEMATLHRKTCNIPPHAGPFEEVLEKWGDMIDRYMVSFARKVIAEKMPTSEEINKYIESLGWEIDGTAETNDMLKLAKYITDKMISE